MPPERIVWTDLLRLIAIFMVICIHCSDPFNVSPETRSHPDYNLWGGIYGAFLRPCVPLFVMLTGMLLLPVRQEMGVFYRKRMLRIIVPFLIWSLLYNCGLGIYMIHYFIVGIGYLVVDRMDVPIALRIPVTAVFVFLVSWGMVSLTYRWMPRYAKWIMG